MRGRRYGEHAVLLECADAAEVRAVVAAARRACPDADDVVAGARTVVVDGVTDPVAVLVAAAGWRLEPVPADSGPLVEVPVRYDGPDLAEVAQHWRLTVPEAVAVHRDREYVVDFCGFAPGFAYCSGLPATHAVRRLARPRDRVPAGAVAVAGTWTAVYPRASPGGWRLLGRTDLSLWDPDADPPALLRPGTRVRFVEVGGR